MSEENPCLKFFEAHINDPSKVKALQKEANRVAWEKLTASKWSPGPVESEEQVLRLFFQPIHIDFGSMSLKPTAVDDASNKGMSVDRLSHRTREKAIEEGFNRAAMVEAEGRTSRRLVACAQLPVASIRSLASQDGERAFGVYDTGQEDNLAHADACQLVSGKQAGRSVRSHLVDLCDRHLEFLEAPIASEPKPQNDV